MLIFNLFCQQPVMLIDQLSVNLTNWFTKKHITNYHNRPITCYPIIIKIVLKILLPHWLLVCNNQSENLG